MCYGELEMSYSLVFSRVEIPNDVSDPWEWVNGEIEKYYEDDRGPHPTLQELYDQLTAKYPCICDLSDEEIDNGVWADGPLINNFAQDLAMVSISFSVIEEVAPFVIETANALNITVFDHQNQTIYSP